jgi:hypothetical protein
MRDEGHRETQRLRDLRRVLVAADLVGGEVVEYEAGVRRRLRTAARARHSRLRVDDHTGRIDRADERGKGEQGSGRIAPRVGDQPAGRRPQLGQRVCPALEQVRARVLEAVPLRIRGRRESVRARQIDDDAVASDLRRRRRLVVETQERQRRCGIDRLLLTHEGRQRSVEPDVESRRGRTGERVRAEGHDVELRMQEDAVERLLTGVAAATDDGGAEHRCVLCQISRNMQRRQRA